MRDLIQAYDAKLMHDWDRTAPLCSLIYTLTTVVHNANSKRKIKPKTASFFHPYRKPTQQGLKITKENFGSLRTIGNALVKRK